MVPAALARALTAYFASAMPLHGAEHLDHFCAQILLQQPSDSVVVDAEPGGSTSTTTDMEITSPRQVLVGLSQASYVNQLTLVLAAWYEAKVNPLHVHLPPLISGVVEAPSSSLQDILSIPYAVMEAYVDQVLKEDADLSSSMKATSAFMGRIGGARGVLTLLGFRHTVGSRNVPPLTRAQCLHSFTQSHGKVTLTVGARAFTKHCQRSADGWWGDLKGNDAAKNRIALAKVLEILDTAVWKNIHSLPHAQVTMELRNALGYGARWTVEDQAFRGFLEPQMENGHEARWRH
uniref:Uncharacterized protein n=1 Tax=Globisporangium ultimum (strain ATCC 200006 / CBS 805.95 / DAOM BR144) TaxID=431595 RepID=K3X6B4_GLOUD